MEGFLDFSTNVWQSVLTMFTKSHLILGGTGFCSISNFQYSDDFWTVGVSHPVLIQNCLFISRWWAVVMEMQQKKGSVWNTIDIGQTEARNYRLYDKSRNYGKQVEKHISKLVSQHGAPMVSQHFDSRVLRWTRAFFHRWRLHLITMYTKGR